MRSHGFREIIRIKTIRHIVEFVWVTSADHLREWKLLRQRVSTIRGWFKRKIFLRAVSKGPSPVVDRFHLGMLVADPARASYYDPFSPDRLQWLIFWSAQNSVGTFQFRESRSVPNFRIIINWYAFGTIDDRLIFSTQFSEYFLLFVQKFKIRLRSTLTFKTFKLGPSFTKFCHTGGIL